MMKEIGIAALVSVAVIAIVFRVPMVKDVVVGK